MVIMNKQYQSYVPTRDKNGQINGLKKKTQTSISKWSIAAIAGLTALSVSIFMPKQDIEQDANQKNAQETTTATTTPDIHKSIIDWGQDKEKTNKTKKVPSASDIGTQYKMGNKTFMISPMVHQAFRNTEARTGFPYKASVAVCGRESDCIPTKTNTRSQACGLFQLMTKNPYTLYEALHKHGPENGYTEEAKLVTRFVKTTDKNGNPILGYKPENAEAKEKISELCLKPQFNTDMFVAYTMPKIKQYQKWLGNREVTVGEIVAMNNLGRRGLQTFATQAWEDKKSGASTLAVDFFKKHKILFGGHIPKGTSLITHPDGTYKTVRESYNDIINFGGSQEVTLPAINEPSA